MSVSTNSINLSHMQVDDSSLTTHFHDLHNVSIGSKDADFPMYDESEKRSSTPKHHDFEIFSKNHMNEPNELLDYKFYRGFSPNFVFWGKKGRVGPKRDFWAKNVIFGPKT